MCMNKKKLVKSYLLLILGLAVFSPYIYIQNSSCNLVIEIEDLDEK